MPTYTYLLPASMGSAPNELCRLLALPNYQVSLGAPHGY